MTISVIVSPTLEAEDTKLSAAAVEEATDTEYPQRTKSKSGAAIHILTSIEGPSPVRPDAQSLHSIEEETRLIRQRLQSLQRLRHTLQSQEMIAQQSLDVNDQQPTQHASHAALRKAPHSHKKLLLNQASPDMNSHLHLSDGLPISIDYQVMSSAAIEASASPHLPTLEHGSVLQPIDLSQTTPEDSERSSEEPEPAFRCHRCQDPFDTIVDLRSHMSTAHRGSDIAGCVIQ